MHIRFITFLFIFLLSILCANAASEAVKQVSRLTTSSQHIDYLKDALPRAKTNILITTYGVSGFYLKSHGIIDLFREAWQRGVTIYIYNNDKKEIDEDLKEIFKESAKIKYSTVNTHAKHLVVDKTTVAIGSYNWLAGYNDWADATLCLEGSQCKRLAGKIWNDICFFRNKQFKNTAKVQQYKSTPRHQETFTWEISDGSLSWLHSIKMHQQFIQSAFEKATNRVIFFTPFIVPFCPHTKDFSEALLKSACNRGVHVYFIGRKEDERAKTLESYLSKWKNPNLHFYTLSKFHLKTVLVDDSLIAEGSFNWHSASRIEDSSYHNHEVALVIEGACARPLIEEFYLSDIGKEMSTIQLINETK